MRSTHEGGPVESATTTDELAARRQFAYVCRHLRQAGGGRAELVRRRVGEREACRASDVEADRRGRRGL